MSNQENNTAVTINNKEVSYMANDEEVKLSGSTVRNYLVRGNGKVTDQEVVMFINLCKFQKLNPFLNEAYLVKFGGEAQIITSKEAFMKRANRNINFDGLKAGLILGRKKDNGVEIVEVEGSFSLKEDELLGAWCEVYLKDKKYPMTTKINLEEFNKGQSTWKKMPKTMIRKTAMVQALREAFPEDLGALYTSEETDVPESQLNVKEEIEQRANSEELDFDTKPQPSKVEQPKEDVIDAEYEEVEEEQINGQMKLDPEQQVEVPY